MKATLTILAILAGSAAWAADPVKIVYIGKNTGNPYFDSITGGFQDACKELGCEFEFVAPATAEATSQIPFIEAQTQRGVNVIAIAPNSPDALNASLDAARAKGVLVLTVNGDITGNEGHRDANILPVDFTKTGPNQIDLVCKLIEGCKGEIAILSATTEAPDQNRWIEDMKKTLAEDAKYKDLKLVATVYGDDLADKSYREAQGLMQTYPDLKAIIAPTSVGIVAAAQAVTAPTAWPPAVPVAAVESAATSPSEIPTGSLAPKRSAVSVATAAMGRTASHPAATAPLGVPGVAAAPAVCLSETAEPGGPGGSAARSGAPPGRHGRRGTS